MDNNQSITGRSLFKKRSFSAGDVPKGNGKISSINEKTEWTHNNDHRFFGPRTVSQVAVKKALIRASQVVFEDFDEVEEYIFDDSDFPFVSLVFEGGGNKGMAYVGALEVSHLACLNYG